MDGASKHGVKVHLGNGAPNQMESTTILYFTSAFSSEKINRVNGLWSIKSKMNLNRHIPSLLFIEYA